MKRRLKLGDQQLPWNQRGFRPGGQCADIVEIVDTLIYTHQVYGEEFCLTQADLEKAYDSM